MRIRRNHGLEIDEAKRRVVVVTEKLESRFALTSEWRGDVLVFRGTSVRGRITVADDNVEISVRLGLALLIMEGPIRSAIEETLDDQLAI